MNEKRVKMKLKEVLRPHILKILSEIYAVSASTFEETHGGGYSGNKAFLEQLLSNCEQNIKFYEDQLKTAKSKKLPKESIAVIKRNLDYHKDNKAEYKRQLDECK